MRHNISHSDNYIILGGNWNSQLPANVTLCQEQEKIYDIVKESDAKRTVFISYNYSHTEALLEEVIRRTEFACFRQLLTIHSMPSASSIIPALQGIFKSVVGIVTGYNWLPKKELIAAITAKDAEQRFIGGIADAKTETLTLVRGNNQQITLPFSFFQTSGDGIEPNFMKLGFTDYGSTVVLGEYEAAADAILYEIDADYRRKLNKHRIETEKSFGAALRRLRIQRKLQRSDFAPLSAKTIARLERGEVEKPHGNSLNIIAERLSVSPEQIETY